MHFCNEFFMGVVTFNSDRSVAVLLLWFLTVAYSCFPNLYIGSPIMLVTYFNCVWIAE